MTTALSIIIILVCFLGFGFGIFFLGKRGISGDCGSRPKQKETKSEKSDNELCPSQEMGLCPMEDEDGYLEMATKGVKPPHDHDQKSNNVSEGEAHAPHSPHAPQGSHSADEV